MDLTRNPTLDFSRSVASNHYGGDSIVAPLVAIGIGAGLGLVGGYLWDQVLGDGDYTAREAVVDAAGGAIGGSLAKPLLKGGGRFAHTVVSYRARGGALSAVTGRE